MKKFIKVSNNIFEKGLSPKAVWIYLHLLNKMNLLHAVTISAATLAVDCQCSVPTVRTALAELQYMGYISKHQRYTRYGYRATNRYYVVAHQGPRGWFAVPTEILTAQNINATEGYVFAFILRHMGTKKKEAFPSLRRIQSDTGLSRTTICKALAHLRNFSFLNRVHRKYYHTTAYRHNRYLFFKVSTGSKRACTTQCKLPQKVKLFTQSLYTNILLRTSQFVKGQTVRFFIC